MAELIARDKNHPSVIMWSVANEPMPSDMVARFTGGELGDVNRAAERKRDRHQHRQAGNTGSTCHQCQEKIYLKCRAVHGRRKKKKRDQ